MMARVGFISIWLFITISSVRSIESFNDFPLVLDKGDYMVQAKLTDLTNSKEYFFVEFIHASSESLVGKISIYSDSSSIDVHYGSSLPNLRLALQDYECDPYTYRTNKWDKRLPEVASPLLNHILLVGPSLVYRLKHKSLSWKMGNDTDIRGTVMQSATTTLGGQRLTINYFYKDTYTLDDGIAQPSRIQFIGIDPSDASHEVKMNLLLDIYLQTKTSDNLEALITPKPGVGCPFYFASNELSFENLVESSVHYISIEKVDGPTKSNSIKEIYADQANQVASLKITSQGVTTEVIHDYILGLTYNLQNSGECTVTPMESNTIGFTYSFKPLQLNFFLNTKQRLSYAGPTFFENEVGFRTDVWEATYNNYVVASGVKYDKVVLTLYSIDSKNSDTRIGKILVGETQIYYNKDSAGKYAIVESTKKVYHNFGQNITDQVYEGRFRLADCYPDPSNRKTLAFHFKCDDGNCDFSASDTFKRDLKGAIQSYYKISSSRFGDIDIVVDSGKIIAYVTFLDFPSLPLAFKSSHLRLASSVFEGLSMTSAESSLGCLNLNAKGATSFQAVAYCPGRKTCARISNIDDLVESKDATSVDCVVFNTKLKNLERYDKEVPLNQILEQLTKSNFGLTHWYETKSSKLSLSEIVEVKEEKSKLEELYILEEYERKLVQDGVNTVKAIKADKLSDCYRACANSDENDCETFSFCGGVTTECLLSSSVYANVTDQRKSDPNCRIYRKNRLLDYVKIPRRQFLNPTSIATNHFVDDCADLCSQTDECFTFQSCYGTCRFGGYYTDAITKYSDDCDIYMPKLTQKFALTGKKIVTEVYHTELNVTLDQCAALCYDFGDSNGQCISYNYCPKGQTASSCNLSKYSVKDASTKTIDSDICTNYEQTLEETKGDKQIQKMNEQPKGGSIRSAGIFGIILLCTALGLVTGAIGNVVYGRLRVIAVNSTLMKQDTLKWIRQIDEDVDAEQSVC